MAPKSQSNGKAPRTRRTKAQIEEDLKVISSSLPTGSKPTAADVKRSRIAAERSRSTSTSSLAKINRDSPPFDLVDYQTIISYLAKPNIRNALFGGGNQTRVSGLPMNPKTLLNPLAIELNNNYNVRHDSKKMRLNGRVLHMRLKRYKSKYAAAKAFSEKTGSGLSAKNVAEGIHTMEDLLESMCPCFKDMDTLFGEKGNVTPFGILDSGVGPQDCSQDGSDGDSTDGHCHGLTERMALGKHIQESQEAFVQDPEEIEAFTEIFDRRFDYESHDDDESVSRPATPNTFDEPPPLSAQAQPSVPPAPVPSTSNVNKNPARKLSNTHPARQTSKKKPSTVYARKGNALTEQERALDSSSDDEITTTTTPQATQGPSGGGSARPTLARRAVDPLPSIDPAHVHAKEHKHALAAAIQQGNEAKLHLLNKANEWRQQMETSRLEAELEARTSSLTWDKEKYFLDRQDQRETEQRRLEHEAQKERKAFCERLVSEGKTPQELDAFLRLVYPSEYPENGNWV